MPRPQTLAEVAQIARARPADFAMALDEFADEFYLDHGNKPAQQDRLDPVPEPVADPRIDAWIGAVGEHLAQRWGLRVPPWTQREPITRSAPCSTASRSRGSCSGWWDPSASISTITS